MEKDILKAFQDVSRDTHYLNEQILKQNDVIDCMMKGEISLLNAINDLENELENAKKLCGICVAGVVFMAFYCRKLEKKLNHFFDEFESAKIEGC